MQAFVAGGEIATCGSHSSGLETIRGQNSDFRSNRIAVARVPNKFQRQPMLCRRSLIAQHIKRPVIRGHDCVQTTIIVDVSNRHATPHPGFSKNATRLRRDVFKAVACVPCQQHGFAVAEVWKRQFDRVQIMPLRDE